MTRHLLLLGGLTLAAALTAAAQDSRQPAVFDTFFCQQMSGNGEWMLGRSNTYVFEETGAKATETSVLNTVTGEIYGTGDLFTLTPFSKAVSSKGIALLSTYDEATGYIEVPYLFVPGQEPIMLLQLFENGPYKGKECYACAITDDASAFLAYYEVYPKQYPFVCSINDDLSIGEPEFLPLPPVDLFGNEPFNVMVSAISDDGCIAAGIVEAVVPGIGTIGYPIVYRRLANGTWEYELPLGELYEDIDPENVYDFYSWQIALSPDGSKMACTQEVPTNLGTYDDYYVWVIDLVNGTYETIKSDNHDIVATQILDDGTVVGTFFATIKISYIHTPGAEDFVDFVEYANKVKPAYGKWMEDNLMVMVIDTDMSGNQTTVKMPNTGQVYMSYDGKAFGSGFQTSQYDEYHNQVLWSYLFTDFETTRSCPIDLEKDEVLDVYTIHGMKAGTLNSRDEADNLPAGLYIIGGKKVIIK